MPRKITRSKSSIGNINRLTVTCSEALRDEPRTSSEYFQRKFCRDSTELFFSSTVAAIKINARKTSSSRTFDPESTYTKTYRHVSPSSSVKNLVSKNGHTSYLPLLCSWQGSTRFKLFDRIRLTTTFHHQKTLSQHRENIRTTIHETRLVIGISLCTTRHLLRAILSIYVSKRSRAREFSTTGRRTFFERSHFPAGRGGTKTHDTHAMLACRELTTRDNAGRPKPTERARKWPNSPQVLRASTD